MTANDGDAPAAHQPSLEQVASCIDGYDPHALSVEQARDFIARFVPRLGNEAVERLALRSALGRVLAHDVVSPIDVPAHDNSAMDGYALRGNQIDADAATVLRLAGTGLAGRRFEGVVAPGECVRIMTGAVMPDGLDTVVPQELVRAEAGRIVVAAGAVRAGDNRRRAGEDIARGAEALAAGRVLRPADIGLLASLGQAEVSVRRRLRVAFFSTGDELRSVGEPLEPGCVYDSNRYTIHAMLTRLGVEPLDFGVVRDEPAALEAAFLGAARAADAVITSGGVSVGEADHTRRVMASLGDVAFWHIAMRPGRPMAFGRVGSERPGEHSGAGNGHGHGAQRVPPALLFGLPGNPVAVMVTFYAFVRDALLAMSGATPTPVPMLRARCSEAIRKKPGRTEYQRGILARAADGDWHVSLTGAQGSGMLRSMSLANGLVVLHHGQGPVAAGERVDVLPFDGLI